MSRGHRDGFALGAHRPEDLADHGGSNPYLGTVGHDTVMTEVAPGKLTEAVVGNPDQASVSE